MTLSNDLLAVPLEATTTLNGNRLVTTLDNLPAAPVTSFELTINGGPNGLFTVGNPLCTGATIDTTFTSHTGQTANDSSPVNLVGNCVPVPAPGAAAKPSLSVSVRRLPGAPLTSFELTINGGPNGLFTVGNPLCTGATIDTTFTSHTGQTANDSSPVNLVGNCVPVPAPGAAAKPSLSVSVRRLSGAPL